MKRIFLSLFIILISLSAYSADYDALWKKVNEAKEKDMPRQVISILDRIIHDAEKEQCHAELLAATSCRLQIISEISADSIVPSLNAIVCRAEQYEQNNNGKAIAAVYYTVLAKWAALSENTLNDSICISKALANPDILAETKAQGFRRMTEFYDSDKLYHNDLLSLVGHELQQYALLKDYYLKQGNKRAACMELYLEVSRGVYDSSDNSLTIRRKLLRDGLRDFSDVPEVALLADEYYSLMQDDDFTDAARYIYLNDKIKQYEGLCDEYGCQQYVYSLKNALLSLTCPRINITIDKNILLSEIRNVKRVRIEFSPLKADGTLSLNPSIKKERQQIETLINGEKTVLSSQYDKPVWMAHADTIDCPLLPYGVYLVKVSADDLVTYTLWYNSDLTVISLPVSKQEQRIIVASATTGQPVPYADVVFTKEDYKGNVKEKKICKTDAHGEIIFNNNMNAGKVYVSTDNDRAFRKTYYYAYFNRNKTIEKRNILTLFTDRSIYRPGQTIRGCVVAHNATDVNAMKIVEAQNVVLTLENMQAERIFSDTLTTNSDGNAMFNIELPENEKGGSFVLSCHGENAITAIANIRIEEYKRPTFEVKACDEYNEVIEVEKSEYDFMLSDPDSLQISFRATEFTGTPIRNASVTYSITRRQEWYGWWRRQDQNNKIIIHNATTRTDHNGCVTVTLPLSLPEASAGIYAFNIKVSVTSLNGESQETTLTVRARHANQQTENYTQPQKSELPEFHVTASRFTNNDDGIVFSMRRHPETISHNIPVVAYYTIFTETGVLESGKCEFDTLYTRRFIYDEKYGEGLTIAYSWIQNGQAHEYVRTLLRPLPEMSLNISWSSFRDRTQPGSDECWTLRVADTRHYTFIATVYDKSLDALMPTTWTFFPHRNGYVLSASWRSMMPQIASGYVMKNISYLKNFVPEYARLKSFCYPLPRVSLRGAVPMLMGAKTSMRKLTGGFDNASNDMASVESIEENANITDNTIDVSHIVRTDFAETAFFGVLNPAKGSNEVNMTFRMPQTITSWRVRGFAYDTSMHHSFIDTLCVAEKLLVVKPNVPRFLRQHDAGIITAEVQNTSSLKQEAEVIMQLLDMNTDSLLWQDIQQIVIPNKSSLSVSAKLPDMTDSHTLIYRVVARTADGTSDGEQHFIPVIADRQTMTVTRAFTQHGAGTYETNISDMIVDGSSDRWLRIKYTDDAAQLIYDAIPQNVSPSSKDALSLASAVYLLQTYSLPDTSGVTKELAELQNADGSWSWWSGMDGSVYVTTAVAKLFARLNYHGLHNEPTDSMLRKALPFLLSELAKEADHYRQLSRRRSQTVIVSSTSVDILYICALVRDKYAAQIKKSERDIKYLVSLTEKYSDALPLQNKAQMAVIYAADGSESLAREYIRSLKEYTVYTPEAGRYFEARRAQYSWRNYRIPTQVAVIEAIRMITPDDKQTIEEMLRWLLHEKRTQQWDNSLNTADAIYAFMQGYKVSDNDKQMSMPLIKLNDKVLVMDNNMVDVPLSENTIPAVVSVEKTSSTTSWGAIMLEQTAAIDFLNDYGEGFSVKREVISDNERMCVGDKVKVRITITADRDYDFVELRDNRPACLQPVQQLSGYCAAATSSTARHSYSGYYRVIGDNVTTYYFDKMAKGRHVVETEYYIDRPGEYVTGLTTVISTYACEFSCKSRGEKVLTFSPEAPPKINQ